MSMPDTFDFINFGSLKPQKLDHSSNVHITELITSYFTVFLFQGLLSLKSSKGTLSALVNEFLANPFPV